MTSFCINFSKAFISTPIPIDSGNTTTESTDQAHYEQLIEKCICSEGATEATRQKITSRKWNNTNPQCEKVSVELFGKKLQEFMRHWDTEGLSEIQLQQEKLLWACFFGQDRDNSAGVNNMAFYRQRQDQAYAVEISGENIDKVKSAIKEEFKDEEVESVVITALNAGINEETAMKKVGKIYKGRKAEIRSKGKLHNVVYIDARALFGVNPLQNLVYDTNQDYMSFIQKNMAFFDFTMMNPFVAYYFGNAGTISKMSHLMNYGGINVIHQYSSFKAPSFKAHADKV